MAHEDDFTARAGGAAIGARLRRLSAAIDEDATRVYAALGIDFEQRWFGVLNQLARSGPRTVGELAAALGITHVSVSQTRRSLEEHGLVATRSDPGDARRRVLALTRRGERFVGDLTPLWRTFDEVARELDAEAGHVVEALDRLERALARTSLFDRLIARAPVISARREGPRKAARPTR